MTSLSHVWLSLYFRKLFSFYLLFLYVDPWLTKANKSWICQNYRHLPSGGLADSLSNGGHGLGGVAGSGGPTLRDHMTPAQSRYRSFHHTIDDSKAGFTGWLKLPDQTTGIRYIFINPSYCISCRDLSSVSRVSHPGRSAHWGKRKSVGGGRFLFRGQRSETKTKSWVSLFPGIPRNISRYSSVCQPVPDTGVITWHDSPWHILLSRGVWPH